MIEDEATTVDATLDRVIEGLRLGERFGFHVVSCASLAQVEHARMRLVLALGERAVPMEVRVTDLGSPRALVERLLGCGSHGVVVLEATVMEGQADRWSLVFQRLNEARNHIMECFEGLVLLLPSPLKSVFALYAPDFFSTRSSSVVLEEEWEDAEQDELVAVESIPAQGPGSRVMDGIEGIARDAIMALDDEERREVEEEASPWGDTDEDDDDLESVLELDSDRSAGEAAMSTSADEPAPEPEPEPKPEPEQKKPEQKRIQVSRKRNIDRAERAESSPSPKAAKSPAPPIAEPPPSEPPATPRAWPPPEVSHESRPNPPRATARPRAKTKPKPAMSAVTRGPSAPSAGPAPVSKASKAAAPANAMPAPSPMPAEEAAAPAPAMRGPVSRSVPSSSAPSASSASSAPGGSTAASGSERSRSWAPRFGAMIDRLRRLVGPRRGRGLDPQQRPLTILLLSSLLVPESTKGGQALQERLRWLVGDLERIRGEHGTLRFDLVVVAGDVASWGREAEMDKARVLLRRLVDHVSTDGQRPSLLLVPGNHDIGKDLAKWRSLVDRGEQLDGMMKQRNNVAIAKEGGQRFRWLVQQLHDEGKVACPPTFEPYLLSAYELEHERRRVAIRGFDSAWGLPWVGHDMGVLGSQQLEAALAGLDDVDFRIAVVHHAPDMMDPEEWALLRETFDLVLTGPSHRASPAVRHSSERAVLVTCPGLMARPDTGDRAGYAVLELGAVARVQLCWVGDAMAPSMVEVPLGPG